MCLKFVNYRPGDPGLGEKMETGAVMPERVEKECLLRAEKFSRASFAENKIPVKIIPKKATLDIENKLKPTYERLRIQTELAVVQMLKEKFDSMKNEVVENEEASTSSENGGRFVARPVLRREAEEDSMREVMWIDDLEGEKPSGFKGDLVGGIEIMEKIHLKDSDNESLEEN